jgi:hypothetical protein
MESIPLVKTSLEYYDKNKEITDKLYKHIFFYKFEKKNNNMENDVIVFFDKDTNELFRSRYEILSIYNKISNTWVWSWAVPRFIKKNTIISRKIFDYGSGLGSDIGDIFLKTELITSRFRITNPIQLEIHIAIASYLSKNKLIYMLMPPEDDTDVSHDYTPVYKNTKQITYLFLLDYERIINIQKIDDDYKKCDDI